MQGNDGGKAATRSCGCRVKGFTLARRHDHPASDSGLHATECARDCQTRGNYLCIEVLMMWCGGARVRCGSTATVSMSRSRMELKGERRVGEGCGRPDVRWALVRVGGDAERCHPSRGVNRWRKTGDWCVDGGVRNVESIGRGSSNMVMSV